MTTPNQYRCKDCIYLVEGPEGEWICDDAQMRIDEIDDEDCSMEQDW